MDVIRSPSLTPKLSAWCSDEKARSAGHRIDLGRYAITMQSLRTLASAGARAVMISCYTPALLQSPPQSPSICGGDPMSTTAKQTAAPFLYRGGLTPTLSVASSGSNLTVTASQAGFTMLMPIWGTALNAPSASTQIPF